MAVTRTTESEIKEGGYIFRVVADRDDVEGLADEMIKELQGAAEINMEFALDYALAEIKKTLAWPGGGVPSRANEPPRYQTGDLYKSWKKGRKMRWRERGAGRRAKYSASQSVLQGELFSSHPAAGPLEFGAIKSLSFGPRPYYRPTIARIADRLGRIMAGDL